MRVLFCGTSGGGTFELDRANASILVESGATAVLLDCGAGSLRQLVASGRELTDIRAVAISHIHHDHVLGLAELFGRLVALNAGAPPPVYGPRGTVDFVARLVELVKPLARRGFAADDVHAEDVIAGAPIQIDDLVIEPFEVRHVPELQSFGWRARGGGRMVVYSGDTSAVPEIMVPAARDAHLLIHDAFSDASFERLKEHRRQLLRARLRGTIEPSEVEARVDELSPQLERFSKIHGVAREVGALATAASVGRLALTSIGAYEDPAVLEAAVRTGYAGPLVTASDGLIIEV